MKKLKRLPIGRSDFKSIIEDNMYYIDKSMLIKDIIESGNVVLITRPRRFGKTLNMTMMKYFFRNDQDNKHLFEGLKIWEEKEIREKYLNKYPTIFISFKDLKQPNIEDMILSLKEIISSLYNKYTYLLETKEITQWDKKKIVEILDKTANKASFENSIKNLTEYLYRYYKQKVILLIDEYDTPIQQSYLNGYYNEFINFMGNILGNALKDNEYLEKGVLTGITRVAKESIFTGVNNLQASTVLSELFNDKFGLTWEEVEETLKYYGLEYEKEKVIEWYNGYNFGGKEIYNPYSIINLARNNGEIKYYWINSSGNELIKQLIRQSTAEVKTKIEELIEGKEIESSIDENLVYGDLDKSTEESIWTLFLFTGYLTWVEHVGEEGEPKYKLRITNKETKRFFENTVINILEENKIEYENILLLLKQGKKIEFSENFKRMVEETISYFDVSGEEPERFYHGLILGMIVGLKNKYIIKSNREAGYGRADLILIPKEKTEPGIIFEFKKYSVDFDKDLKDSAEKGLKQIEERGYEKEIKSYGIEKIIKVAIAFYKKNIEIIIK
ncbi:AAA family ATPase [Marinitoga aeolica]|uniref:AAA family ATPase n=1 Tax=Marinitoga aeolica TaxID=2809031 RepID=A0ABY8PTG4_9BACT|nr:AAA family ATPase [Marinitoga aeolica]WGS65890.1 AAA family ATPase [Marinitoga aeolica]